MTERFFSDGRRRLLGQMCVNVCQYLLIAAIASELLRLPLIHRVIIAIAAGGFGVAGVLIWPKGDGR